MLANKMFSELDKIDKNLGDTVTFDTPPLVDSTATIAFGTFGDVQQNQVSLVVDQQAAVPIGVSNLERIFNLERYMTEIGKSAIAVLSTKIGENIALNNVNHTNRTFGDGTAAGINSYQELAQAVANYRNAGNPVTDEICGIIPDVAEPAIIGDGLNKFALNRNNEIANSWELGEFTGVKWYRSNLLPVHTAGTVGQDASTLTVVSSTTTQLTLSGATASDADAIKAGDVLTFQDGVTGQPNMRFLTYFGNHITNQLVQVRATADAGADGAGQVVVNIAPALISTPGDKTQNINNPVAAGMELKVLNSHTAGLLFSKRALMLAMPKLPPTNPFESGTETDPMTGASLRSYYGHIIGQASDGYAHDCIWGTVLVDIYGMRLAFPA